MEQLSDTASITLEAFRAALVTCTERGIDLPEAIQAVAPDLQSHIEELDELSELDATFDAFYQAERLAIQHPAATRGKRLSSPEFSSSTTDSSRQVSSTIIRNGVKYVVHRSQVSDNNFPLYNISPSLSSLNAFNQPDATSLSVSNSSENSVAANSTTAAAGNKSAKKKPVEKPTEAAVEQPQRPIIYRYTLPLNSPPEAISAFSRQVEAIRQQNPDWFVDFDIPEADEANAIFLIRRDEHYPQVHAAYLASRTLRRVVAPALNRIFN